MNNVNLKINVKELLVYIILFFPISSILKVYIGPLNLVLTGLCLVLITYYYTNIRGMNIKERWLLFYVWIIIVVNCAICKFKFFNINMLFYYPFFIIYFSFFIKEQDYIYGFLNKHKKYVDIILLSWCTIVFVSLFIPSCYRYEGETRAFVSFAGTTFLLAPIAMYIFALLIIQYKLYKNKIYLIALILPSVCILFGSTRTYIVGLMCAWLIFIYLIMRNKKRFFITLSVSSVLFIMIVLNSPIKNKFIDTSNRTELGLDPLNAFTSGRSVFWKYDMQVLLKQPWYKIIFGNGNNYLFYLNDAKFKVPLWAHNDFLQLFSDYGILGELIYLFVVNLAIKSIMGKNKSFLLRIIVYLMWIFIAFFNMFYTYFCMTLAFPFYLLVIKKDNYIDVSEEKRR